MNLIKFELIFFLYFIITSYLLLLYILYFCVFWDLYTLEVVGSILNGNEVHRRDWLGSAGARFWGGIRHPDRRFLQYSLPPMIWKKIKNLDKTGQGNQLD